MSGKIRHYRQMGRLIRYTPEDVENNMKDFAAEDPKPVKVPNVASARFG